MHSRNLSAIMLWLPLVILFSCWCTHAKNNGPRIKTTKFDSRPGNLQYFEDSDTILVQEPEKGRVWHSIDAGENWEEAKDLAGEVARVVLHPYNNEVAYALGPQARQWVTFDQGKNWESFELPNQEGKTGHVRPDSDYSMSFHAGDSKKVIVNTKTCDSRGRECMYSAHYSMEGFKDGGKFMNKNTNGCLFVHETPLLATGPGKDLDNRVYCIVDGKESKKSYDRRLYYSDKWFEGQTGDDNNYAPEPLLDGQHRLSGIVKITATKGFLLAAAVSEGSTELALYISADGSTWDRAEFPHTHKIEEDAYTVLESTNYSLQVDVMNTKPMTAMGVFLTSNSNGTYFTENIQHTNRNMRGNVDFEKMQGIQGIVFINIVDNWKKVAEANDFLLKKIKSQVSFDDGRTWSAMKVDKDDLHLHMVTDQVNVGRVLSSAAPGLVLGVGNTGTYRSDYKDGNLYVSDDAGLTWKKALNGPHKYEFGDQGNVLLAIKDDGATKEFSYSINHGKDWETVEFEEKTLVDILTTTPDSTSLRFVTVGKVRDGSKVQHVITSFDFAELELNECVNDDFEDWYARRDDKGEPDCLMGHKQLYRRRKPDSKCFVRRRTHEPLPKAEPCACTKEDYECDFNFVIDEKNPDKCIPATTLVAPKNSCKKGDETFRGSSGYRRIPGNDCIRDNGEKLDEEIDRPCTETVKEPASGNISKELTRFPGKEFIEHAYPERTEKSTGTDETVFLLTDKGEVYKSKDHGKTWLPTLKGNKIIRIIPHTYFKDVVFFLTTGKKVFITTDRGEHYDDFEAPLEPRGISPLVFSQDSKELLIWLGASECERGSSRCHTIASYSTNRGANFNLMLRFVRHCEFIKREGRKKLDGSFASEKLVMCEQHVEEDNKSALRLVSSEDWFVEREVKATDEVAFATMAEYTVVAVKGKDDNLLVQSSVDGSTFAPAKLPADFVVPHFKAVTVLDSSTHAIFMHVTVSTHREFEYGRLMKSNSNGTNYVSLEAAVNRDADGYVDFEKMQGIEGIAMVNIVDNVQDEKENKAKRLVSRITHNDGAIWDKLMPPTKDAEGKDYCKPSNDCALHLHSYTEREDPSDTFSSPSAVGLMMGVGNVGDHLGDINKADTFITKDGGRSWEAVKKGRYMWEYGDQGGIIVIVKDKALTKELFYTTSSGFSWERYQFSDFDIEVTDLTTTPSDNSQNFLIWGRDPKKNEILTVNVDFSQLFDRECVLDKEKVESDEGDYRLWTPQHPAQEDQCLFGHVTRYYRKAPDAKCWNGKNTEKLHDKAQICECRRQDFECDYNYAAQPDGSCALVQGLQPQDHALVCKTNPNQVSYYEPTGYRKIPISTCSGGKELDKWESKERPCPGHQKEFEETRRGLSGFAFFLVAICLPFTIAGGIGYYVWKQWSSGSMGRIRLGDHTSAFDADQPWIQYPVLAISAVLAIVAAIPLLMSSLWRSASGMLRGSGRRYTTRESFARGRGDYAAVDADEDELLGEDDDEEV